MWVRYLIAGLVAMAACAQDEQEANRAIIKPTTAAEEYHPPTAQKRWRDFASDTFGPFALLTTAASAGIEQLTYNAPEWGQGAKAYGIRFGDEFGRSLVGNSIQYSAAAVLHEDLGYYKCECRGLWQRAGHALLSTFTARRPNGKRTFAISRVMGNYGGGMISQFWYPHRYTPLGDGVRIGNWGFGYTFGVDIANEFWPDVRRKVFKK
jgi:hypothetical protein